MADKELNHVEKVAAKFGPYLTDFSKAIGVAHSTVNSWLINGNIPKWYHDTILKVAKKLNISLTEEELKKPGPV